MAWRDWRVTKTLSRFFLETVEVDESPRPEILIEAPVSAKDRSKSVIKKVGLAYGGTSGSRLTFEGPAGFDFNEIERAYLTDSYIRQAVDKYVDYMFKAGWDIVGKNTKAVDYIKMRFAAMEAATDKPTGEFLTDIAEDLIKYHNCFIAKARAPNTYQYPPGITATPALANKTVAGYFVLPVSTLTIARDTSGMVKKYKQEIKGGGSSKPIELNPVDMIHIAIDRPHGRAFGFPFLAQALDDVKLLRQIEELVDRLIYKNIFPLMVYKVGLEKEGFQSTDEEIEEVRAQLGELTMDGGIVIPERHDIKAVGVEGQALNVEGYLKYFKQRVFTSLGVSPTIMGEGDTSNRSTSDNMDQMFKDRIKAFQKTMAENITAKIIYEMLLEGGFDPLTRPEDKVEFRFREIDLHAKMAEQNHVVQLYTQNAITHEQMRILLGYDPVTPEEEERLYYRQITATLAIQAAAAKLDAANNSGSNKNQPTNQHGTTPAAKTTKNSLSEALISKEGSVSMYSAMVSQYVSLQANVIKNVSQSLARRHPSEFDEREIELALRIGAENMASLADKYIMPAFLEGASDAQSQAGKQGGINYTYNSNLLRDDFKKLVHKLMTDLKSQVARAVKSSDRDAVSQVVGAFEALKYRLKFMSTTQIYSAYNIGFVKMARTLGYNEAYISTDESGCDVCKDAGMKSMNLISDKLPPFHPNCTCRLTLKKEDSQ